LNPEYAHVKSSFSDTSKTVEKLRKQAIERREELRRKKEAENNERLTWGSTSKKPVKKKEKGPNEDLVNQHKK